MSKEIFYRQCELQNGTSRTVGYIEERGAFVGARVEMDSDDGNLWTVLSVGDKRVNQADLQFMRNANRHASIEG